MGRKVAIPWHASFSVAAGVLYFFFVLPRGPELMGDTTHSLGTALRIVTGVLIGLAALPVVFTQMRTRKPELGTPQLALTIRVWSIIGHALAGALIISTAVSEIWLSLDVAGQWLFGIYGAAAAIALLGIFAFYLSFVAELPPPPPKPIKPKKAKQPKKRGLRRKQADDADSIDETDEAEDIDEADEADETEQAEEPVKVAAEPEAEPEAATVEAPKAEGTEHTEDDRRHRRHPRWPAQPSADRERVASASAQPPRGGFALDEQLTVAAAKTLEECGDAPPRLVGGPQPAALGVDAVTLAHPCQRRGSQLGFRVAIGVDRDAAKVRGLRYRRPQEIVGDDTVDEPVGGSLGPLVDPATE